MHTNIIKKNYLVYQELSLTSLNIEFEWGLSLSVFLGVQITYQYQDDSDIDVTTPGTELALVF